MNRTRVWIDLVAGMAVAGLAAPPAVAAAPQAQELEELKAEVAALQERIARLEARMKDGGEPGGGQAAPVASATPVPVPGSDSTGWVSNFTFKGDFRYRNETVDQQYAPARNRDRIRLRAGFVARVNDKVRTEFSLATSEGNDPRAANQTLTGINSRKDVYVDLAYAEWQAAPALRLTAGKMKQAWTRAGASALFDGDINPEGLAASWNRSDLFASATYNIIEERSAQGESTLTAAQLGWRPALGAGRLTLAAGYFDFHGVRGRAPFHDGNPYGNTTATTDCIGGATSCLAYDYDLLEGFVEYNLPVAGRPLALFAHHVTNEAAGNGLDAAWSIGARWGRASGPRTWEIGYNYQRVEKDAVFAQYVDSEIAGGSTDTRAHVLRAGYALARNWVFNFTWQLAETGMDVPVAAGDAGLVQGRDYSRMQLDLNFRF